MPYTPGIASSGTSFVQGAQTMTVADLMANYPAGSGLVGMYARVTDLYGSVDDIMRCRFDGVNYRWVPQRESYNGTNAATSGSVTITPLVSPPTLRFVSTLLGNITTNMSVTNAYIGQRQRIISNGALGLFGFTVAGLVGSNVSLLTGGVKDFEYGPTGWFLAS